VKRLLPSLVLLLTVAGVESACYEDSVLYPNFTQARTRVFLTGMPFPDGFVSTVEVYVVEIAASTEPDTTTGAGFWSNLALPMRRFDLQEMQQSRSMMIGEVELTPDQYHAVRVTIDQDSSIVRFLDGTEANVRWPGEGFLSVYALVEEPISVPDSGTSVVINFDVGQSFASGLGNPLYDFLFTPKICAVNSANTGSINGTILGDPDGDGSAGPIPSTAIKVFRGDREMDPNTWVKTATGFSDFAGYYKVGFLLPGFYIVQIEAPTYESFGSLIAHDVEIIAGEDFIFSVTLPARSAAWIPIWR
jgi:hypothetical protein